MKYKKEVIQKVIEDNPNLTLTELSNLIGIDYHYLSRLAKQWDIKIRDGRGSKNKHTLREFLENNKYSGLTDIANQLKINRSTVYRIIIRNKWQRLYNKGLVRNALSSF